MIHNPHESATKYDKLVGSFMHLYCIINYMQNFLVYFFLWWYRLDWKYESQPYTFAVVLGTNVALPCFLQCWYVQPTTVSTAYDYSYSCFILPHLLSMWSYYIVFLVIFLSFGYMERKLNNRGLRSEFGSVFPSCTTNSILICVPFILFNTLQDQSTAQMPNSQCSTCSVS